MKKGTVQKFVVRTACAAWAVGFLGITAGCDQVGSVLALVRTTATDAVRDTAEAAIQDAVSGMIGDVIPAANGT